jgi:hypothetical protein
MYTAHVTSYHIYDTLEVGCCCVHAGVIPLKFTTLGWSLARQLPIEHKMEPRVHHTWPNMHLQQCGHQPASRAITGRVCHLPSRPVGNPQAKGVHATKICTKYKIMSKCSHPAAHPPTPRCCRPHAIVSCITHTLCKSHCCEHSNPSAERPRTSKH